MSETQRKIAGLLIRGVAQEVIVIDHLAGEIRTYQVYEVDLGTRSDVPLLRGPVLSIPMPKRDERNGGQHG